MLISGHLSFHILTTPHIVFYDKISKSLPIVVIIIKTVNEICGLVNITIYLYKLVMCVLVLVCHEDLENGFQKCSLIIAVGNDKIDHFDGVFENTLRNKFIV